MYNESLLFTHVKRWLTNRINGKAADSSHNSYKKYTPSITVRVLVYNEQTNCLRV